MLVCIHSASFWLVFFWSRVHDHSYLRHLQDKCNALSGLPGTAKQPPHAAPPAFLDVDTPLSATSLDAARRFCGYVNLRYSFLLLSLLYLSHVLFLLFVVLMIEERPCSLSTAL
jgi:hypothetical protein